MRLSLSADLIFLQCVILAAKPALIDFVKSTRSNLGDENITSPEATVKAARTCINAAALSLNIISALLDQDLIGEFPVHLSPLT